MSVPAVQYMDLTADPAALAWPASLPLELALGQQSVRDICSAYGIDRYEYERLRADPHFQQAVSRAAEMLQEDGMAFKIKAQAQAQELLKTAWGLIHAPLDQVPPNVKSDLIKFVIRAAGLDASVEQKAQATAKAVAQTAVGLTINLQLGED